MFVSTRLFVITAAASSLLTSVTGPVVFAQTQHFPPPKEDLLRTCGGPGFALPSLDRTLPTGIYNREFVIPAHPPVDDTGTVPTCENFGWVRLPPIANAQVLIEPSWDGRQFDPGRQGDSRRWDCNHSTIEYGVFATTSVFLPTSFRLLSGFNFTEFFLQRQLIGGGQLFGWLVGNDCIYKVTDPLNVYTFPSGWGREVQATTATTGLLIAVQSWSHNDPDIGHTGTDCALRADRSCWWPTRLLIVTAAVDRADTPCPLPGPTQVVLYQHANFRGACSVLGLGEYAHSDAFAPVGNDSVSSLEVGSNVSVTLYQDANFAGSKVMFTAGQSVPTLGRFNDRASSMKVAVLFQ